MSWLTWRDRQWPLSSVSTFACIRRLSVGWWTVRRRSRGRRAILKWKIQREIGWDKVNTRNERRRRNFVNWKWFADSRARGDKFNLHCCFEFEYFYLSSVNGGRHSSRRELIVALDKPIFFVERQRQKKVVIVVTFHFVLLDLCRMERTTSSKKFNPFETMFFHSRQHSRWGDSCLSLIFLDERQLKKFQYQITTTRLNGPFNFMEKFHFSRWFFHASDSLPLVVSSVYSGHTVGLLAEKSTLNPLNLPLVSQPRAVSELVEIVIN